MANLKLEAERLSVIGNRVLDVAKRLADFATGIPGGSQIVNDLITVADELSKSGAALVGVAGPAINPKLEAERLSVLGNRVLDVAKRLTSFATGIPSGSQIVQDIVGITEDISRSAATLVEN
jgi:hypothetical protein